MIGPSFVTIIPSVRPIWALLGTILLANVYVAVSRQDLWPISTYNMFYMPIGQGAALRSGYIDKSGTIQVFKNRYNSQWIREKYKRALKKKDYSFIESSLDSDCASEFGPACGEMDLIVVRRFYVPLMNGKKEIRNEVAYRPR